MPKLPPASRWIAAAGVVVVAAVAVGATNASRAAKGPASTARASDLVAQARKEALAASSWPSKWQGPTKPTKAQAGKKIVVISCSQATACAQEVAGVVSGGKVIGWKVQVVDGKGDPAVYASAIRNAVTSGADGIILASVNVGLVVDALRFAKQHHVPVLNNAAGTAKSLGVDSESGRGQDPDPNAWRGRITADGMILGQQGRPRWSCFERMTPVSRLGTRQLSSV